MFFKFKTPLCIFAFLLLTFNLHAESLHLITSLDPLEAEGYIKAFQKDTGIKVEWIRLSAGEALARLKTESKNPTQDIWFGAPASEFEAAKGHGLLSRYSSSLTQNIPAKWRDKEGLWTGIYFGAIVFISRNGTPAPLSWNDLLRPEFKNEIVVSYPYTAGTGYTILSGLVSWLGIDKALDYYKNLDGQIRRYTKTGGTPIIEVGLGEANVGIVFDQDALRKGVSRGFPVKITYPADGVAYEIGGVAAIRGGNAALAARFIDWIVSLPAQNMMQQWFRVPLHPKAELNALSKGPGDLDLIKMDFTKAETERERLINKWREKVGK